MRTVLLAVGFPLEIIGLCLAGSDIVAPALRRSRVALAERRRRLVDAIRASLPKRSRGVTTATIGPAVETDIALPITPVKTPPRHEPLDVRVGRLVKIAADLQVRAADLERAVKAARKDAAQELDTARREWRTAIDQALRTAEGEHLRLRAFGLALAVIGGTAVYIAAFV